MIGSLLIVVILVFIGLDGTFLGKKYNSVWSGKYIEGLENDQSKMIAYGIRAASRHNMQPWLVKPLNADTIELYADMDKALQVVDGDYKQFLLSQGTFLESYKMGALQHGYGVDISYNEPDFNEERPLIATVNVYKEDARNTVDAISSCTYGSEKIHENTDLGKTLDDCIAEFPGFKYSIIETNPEVDKLENLLLEATVIESKDEAATKELLDVFRWTEWQKNEYRYGLSLNSMSGALKPFIQPIMKASSNNWEAFGDSGISQFKDRLAKQSKYILIKFDKPSNLEYLYGGQIYQKLIFELNGYVLRPAMQALENFDAMKDLNQQFQKEYGEDGEVIWIIGLQDKTGKSMNSNPRHLVKDIIIQ